MTTTPATETAVTYTAYAIDQAHADLAAARRLVEAAHALAAQGDLMRVERLLRDYLVAGAPGGDAGVEFGVRWPADEDEDEEVEGPLAEGEARGVVAQHGLVTTLVARSVGPWVAVQE